MDIYLFSVVILIGLAVFDLIVGVSNDAVNFLNSPIGSRVAPRHVIMIIASLGMLAGVTFSSGMMEVARKGIFHPQFFLMPELITIFLAVMLTDIILLDFFNTFGLPTSTTVSIVFELLGAAVAVSLIKIYMADESLSMLVNYINTGKALAIISGILISVVMAFFFGTLIMFLTRLVFTFDYEKPLKRYGGLWGGVALSVITYFMLIKGAKGTSFLTPEAVFWIKTHTWTILSSGFVVFAILFQLILLFTRINILKPIILMGTFALAMAFAANDLVNFIGVPMAGMNAYTIAQGAGEPSRATMEALQEPIQSNTFLLLIAGTIMVVTLWISRKSRTVSKTEVTLARQDEGIERFGSSPLSRVIVRMVYSQFDFTRKILPSGLKRIISNRLDPKTTGPVPSVSGATASFDLLRASVNLIVASAVVSFATSMKLPLSTTYVTFMVAMGTSLSDQAWGSESAVYRVTGVLTVIGGWFFTALVAFTIASVFACIIYFVKFPAVLGLVLLAGAIIFKSYRVHFKREEKDKDMATLSLRNDVDAETAIKISFEQTGHFLKEISDTVDVCFDAAFSEDRQRLKNVKNEIDKIQKLADIIAANIFKTLFLLNKEDVEETQTYSHTIRALRDISESHRDMIMHAYEHFDNNHTGLLEVQKQELRQIKAAITRLLRNTGIMLLQRKKVDFDYISNQDQKLRQLFDVFDKNQIKRIQNAQSKTRLSNLFYRFMENSVKISQQTRNLLDIFRESFTHHKNHTGG